MEYLATLLGELRWRGMGMKVIAIWGWKHRLNIVAIV
jgi:hypothetical protein